MSNTPSNKLRVTDYVANRIVELGVKHVFTLTGGGAMFLNDGVAMHPELEAVCNHHEQASAQGGVAYSKVKNSFAVVMPTTGCGSTNTITGLLDAWQDNIPCIFISGQVNKEQTSYNSQAKIRQFGVQEANIIEIVKSLTKYAVMINKPEEIAYHLDKAFYLANTGRKGPVWIDIPMDIQGAPIDQKTLQRFVPPPPDTKIISFDNLENIFSNSKRPIILAGHGIKLADAAKELLSFAEHYNIPVVNTFLGTDLIDYDHHLSIGSVGVKGTRAANFAMQNADLLLSIGTRLSVPVTGYKYDLFAREATIVVVDIDPEEHKKNTVDIDILIECDAKDFLLNYTPPFKFDKTWADTCARWKKQWPVCLEEYKDDTDGISLYYLMSGLTRVLEENTIVVSDAGSAYYVTAQAVGFKGNQKHVTSGAQAEMGFTLPAAIGASFADCDAKVVGITGDGSFQTNIQELQTIVHYNLPIKILVLNNDGYLSIRTTQKKYFNSRFIGTDKNHGVSFPDIKKISHAYGIKYINISESKELERKLLEALEYDGPVICEVFCKKWDVICPTLSAKKTKDGRMISKPLEDMYPFLSREEFTQEMIIKPINENNVKGDKNGSK